MTSRLLVTTSPEYFVEYTTHSNSLFRARTQREGSRRCLESMGCQ